MNYRKILTIIIIILIILIIGLIFYNLYFKKEGEELFFSQEGEEEIAPAPEDNLSLISQEKAMAPVISSDGQGVIYYAKSNGNVWQSKFDGTDLNQISSTVLENLSKIIWSPIKDKVISIYQDNEGNISKYSYDYNTGRATLLDGYIQYTAWSSQGDKIAYHYQNNGTDENSINIANPDGSNSKNIFNTRIRDLIIEWPGEEISLRIKPSGLTQSSIYLLNPSTKAFNKVLSDIYGMSAKWSPLGDKILYSATNSQGRNMNLHMIQKSGGGEKNLNVSTLVEKCTWAQDNRTIFCAIPKAIYQTAVLPDDFYKGTFSSSDTFWKINLDTGEKTLLVEETEEEYDAIDPFLSPHEDYLFFINRKDGMLYSIEL